MCRDLRYRYPIIPLRNRAPGDFPQLCRIERLIGALIRNPFEKLLGLQSQGSAGEEHDFCGILRISALQRVVETERPASG
jgi:hypothetical protein